jgi:ribosomal protein L22
MSANLYEQDFYAWTNEQAALLRTGNLSAADIEHIAEEIEDMGGSTLDALQSNLSRVIEHLLKWRFSPADMPRRGWRRSIVEHRQRIHRAIVRSGSLRRKLPDLLQDAYADARKLAAIGLEEDGLDAPVLPETCPWSLDQITDEDFWPSN